MMLKLMTIGALAVLALGAGAALTACGSDDDDDNGSGGATQTQEATQPERTTTAETRPSVTTITLRNGKPVGGVQTLAFDAGERARFKVRSNVADEVHVHGYDIDQAVPAGGTATFAFPADIEGIFEVESHESGEQLAELRIEP